LSDNISFVAYEEENMIVLEKQEVDDNGCAVNYRVLGKIKLTKFQLSIFQSLVNDIIKIYKKS
jgi:hypothetical protein